MYLTSNIPYFKCWVRKEFTNAHQKLGKIWKKFVNTSTAALTGLRRKFTLWRKGDK
jgi:hypothetical protein